jgi:hypothetical protein
VINGNVYDFESIKVELKSGKIILLEKISYKDKKEDEAITGVDNLPVGIGRGKYSGEVEVEFGRYEYDQLDSYANSYGGFYNLPPLDITVSYGHEGQPVVTDRIQAHFTERDFSGSKGDTNLKVTIKGALTKAIITNGNTAYTTE